ncbi:MAG: hypothetical protein PHG80_11615 [Methanoregulaceae archaeon]|nr:hypothetical protein [Methanoregulaceae archaeon]
MTQATLLTFPFDEETVIQKDRFTARTETEFIRLTIQQLGRKPSAQDWLAYWPKHQAEFEREHGESWRSANARAQKVNREAEAHWARQREKERVSHE